MRPKCPYSRLSSTDEPLFPVGADSGGVVEVLVFFGQLLANQGRGCRYLCALNTHLMNLNRTKQQKIILFLYNKIGPVKQPERIHGQLSLGKLFIHRARAAFSFSSSLKILVSSLLYVASLKKKRKIVDRKQRIQHTKQLPPRQKRTVSPLSAWVELLALFTARCHLLLSPAHR